MTDFQSIKREIEAAQTNDLWAILRHTILGTEEACIRYTYARAELNKRRVLVG
jgi:hypothetical protein